MDAESLRFWIIPISCLFVVIVIFSITLEYKVNIVIPNAQQERIDMKSMNCQQLVQKDATNDYWTPENSKLGREMLESCRPQKQESGSNPYVEFCIPGGFAPAKKIENNTHNFNHDTCIWDSK